MFFSPFSIAITSLVEERANLSAFRFACLVLSISSSSWYLERATVVTVALSVLFSYLSFYSPFDTLKDTGYSFRGGNSIRIDFPPF